jgi:hypothetical protein
LFVDNVVADVRSGEVSEPGDAFPGQPREEGAQPASVAVLGAGGQLARAAVEEEYVGCLLDV